MFRIFNKLTSQEQANKLISLVETKNYSELESQAKNLDINARNESENRWTALLAATKAGDDKAVKILLDNKADPNLCDFGCQQRSPMDNAAIAGSAESLKLLLTYGAKHKDSALSWCVYVGNVNCSKLMLESGADANTKFYADTLRPPVIVLASSKGMLEIVNLLITYEVDINAYQGMEGKGYSNSLMCAARAGHLNCVNRLLEAGVDINSKNSTGKTAVMYAVEGKRTDCLKALLEKGANPNLQDVNLETALHMAAGTGQDECVSLLLQHNASPNLKSSANLKPMF